MLKENQSYLLKENSLEFKSIYLGKYYIVKGDVKEGILDKKSIEIGDYPIYLFYTKDFGVKVFYNLKSFSYEEKSFSINKDISEINKEIKLIRKENKHNKLFNTVLWKSIICFIKNKDDSYSNNL